MAKYLDRFNDAGMVVDESWTASAEDEAQRKRLTEQCVMARYAGQLPRRLGQDASPQELRADKRLCRAVEMRLTTVLRQWGGDPADADALLEQELESSDSELLRTATQVDWDEWWADHKVHLKNEARRIATHALKLASAKQGNRLVHRIEAEYLNLDDVLGDPT